MSDRQSSTGSSTGSFAGVSMPKIISVGNITMGGTGKTPLTIKIARYYMDQGERVCILSRGYRGKLGYNTNVISDGSKLYHTPPHAADEPFMMATELSGLIVVTGKDRRKSYTLAMKRYAPSVFILDDGFQHGRMPRDYDIVILSYSRPFANGRVFPFGTLRQLPKSLRGADAIVVTGVPPVIAKDDPTIATIRNYIDDNQPLFLSRYEMLGIYRAQDTAALQKRDTNVPLDDIRSCKVVLMSAIAGNSRFFTMIEGMGFDVVAKFPFRDHHSYGASDIRRVKDAVERYSHGEGEGSGVIVLTTQKDYVKLAPRFGSMLYYAKVDLKFDHFAKLMNHMDTTIVSAQP